MNEGLTKKVTQKEVLKAFDQMDPRKALDIDRLSGLFYKENWQIVGRDVLRLLDDNLNGNKTVRNINETIIFLICKVVKTREMTQFRPISFCRVIYKIVAMVWANRLKCCLPKCISQNQTAFVPGRMIHDNILIAHETVHYLQSSKNGPNKGFVVKLDMSKAYDSVEWNFLERVILRMGFARGWVEKITDCV